MKNHGEILSGAVPALDPAGRPAVEVTASLGRWVAQLDLSRIPAEVIALIKGCILDSLGCGIYGASQPWGRIAADAVIGFSGGGRASLFGRAEKVSVPDAALANGTAIHGFELDDLHLAGMCHPGAVTLPAALAAAETEAVTGKNFLVAVVAGYEAGIRVGVCAGTSHATSGYHATGTVGTICSAAAVARVLGLDAIRATHALGISATQAAGLYSARMGAMSKRFHAGRAAQSGVLAAYFAARGFTGSEVAIEAPFGGFMSTLHGQSDPATILTGLGEDWETLRVGLKIHASCGSSHTTVDALHEMMARGLTADNLEHLTIRMCKKAMLNVGWNYKPASIVSAQMNGYYVAAVKLLEGAAFIDQFREDLLADPRILRIIERIEYLHDPELDLGGAAKRHAVKVEAKLKDGRKLETVIEQRRGSAERPVPTAEIEHKFRLLASNHLEPAAIDRIISIVANVEHESELGPLCASLRACRQAH
jgi:2-methylcitrate dehydratase PrpD